MRGVDRERRALEAGLPRVTGEFRVPGAEAPIVILRDARGVPHVQAESERDAYFGMGFVHAQDRLGQMLDLLVSARGRAAERAGPAALEADRRARLIGFERIGRTQAAALPRATRQLAEAYAAGVNARLARVRAGLGGAPAGLPAGALPLDRWRPEDSLAVLALYAWGLDGALDTSLVLHDILQRLDPRLARAFFPGGARPGGPGGERPTMALRRERPTPAHGRGFTDPLRRALGLDGAHVGSSAFVVSGALTASGRPLLVSDHHLETTVPSLLYQVHVRGGVLDAAGATVPGVPLLWSGHNHRVAWASTHARAAVVDLHIESLKPEDPGRYHDGKRWRSLEVREESIAVAGAEPASLVVQETRHGPLVNPLLVHEREPLSVAWAGAQEGDPLGPLLRAARARDAAAWRAAVAKHHAPVLSFVYADVDGAAGRQLAGWVPRRSLPSGLVPVSGRSAWAEWRGRVPADRLPGDRVGEAVPWLVTADEPLESGSQRQLEWLWRTGERSARIEALLAEAQAEGPLTLRRAVALHRDVRTGGAAELLAPALRLAGAPRSLPAEEAEILGHLEAWDGRAEPDSVGAAVYHVFLAGLARELLAPVLGAELYGRWSELPQANPVPLLAAVLEGAEQGLPGPEAWSRPRVGDAIRTTLRETWLRFGVRIGPNRDKWSWGRLHALEFRPFGGLRWPHRDPAEVLGPFPFPGDRWTVSAGGFDPAEPFAVRTASTHRFAVDLAEPDKALVPLAPGQSEQPGSPHRSDGIARWLEGRPDLLLTSPVLLEEQAPRRLRLVPTGAGR